MSVENAAGWNRVPRACRIVPRKPGHKRSDVPEPTAEPRAVVTVYSTNIASPKL